MNPLPPDTKIQKIGILVGGGPAPGINSVIHAVALEACRNHYAVFGIYDGFRHLMEGQLEGMPLPPERVAYIYAGYSLYPWGIILPYSKGTCVVGDGQPRRSAVCLTTFPL